MEIKQAIEILKSHNKWRRDDTGQHTMAHPKDLGMAIDTVVSGYKKSHVLYVVTAYRWGDRSNHSYVIAVFDDLEKAKDCAESHKIYRAWKYECVVDEMPLNLYDEDDENGTEVYSTKNNI